MIHKYHPQILWSTYPIATAQLIGLTLSRLSKIPWVADFRDSMTEEAYPPDPLTRRCYQWIEKTTVAHCSKMVFTTESTKKMYLDRYAQLSSNRCLVIPNGFDEGDFRDLPMPEKNVHKGNHPFYLIHSGLIYPEERDPRAFFAAVSKLKHKGQFHSHQIQIVLRGAGSEKTYQAILQKLEILDIVRLLPPLPYQESLQECMKADACLIFQGSSCNHQIPAKAYEYLRMRKPILALTDKMGDTGRLLAECGGATIVDLMDETAITQQLPLFIQKIHEGRHPIPSLEKVQEYSRENQTAKLAQLFDQLGRERK